MDRLIRRRPDGVRARGWAGKFVSDIFHEVDEEVRREQLRKLWDRYGNYVVAAAFLLVAAVAAWRGYMWWGGKKAAESGAAFEAASTLAGTGQRNEAETALAQIAARRTPRHPPLRPASAKRPTLPRPPRRPPLQPMTKWPLTVQWARCCRIWRRCALVRSSSMPAPSTRRDGASSRSRRMIAPFATPRANSWCLLLGAPAIRPRPSAGSI